MALGAQRAGIIWLILRSVLTLELLGLAIGIPVVLAGSRYVESLLFGIKPNDPVALVAGDRGALHRGAGGQLRAGTASIEHRSDGGRPPRVGQAAAGFAPAVRAALAALAR